jgi:hypothetical protein
MKMEGMYLKGSKSAEEEGLYQEGTSRKDYVQNGARIIEKGFVGEN